LPISLNVSASVDGCNWYIQTHRGLDKIPVISR
jgi:hypothetical protein